MIMQQGKSGFDRRQFLKHTAVTTAGACTFLPEAKGLETGDSSSIKNCIFLLLTGGPSQIDTFDPKPDARSEIRGPFKAISTKVPGTFFAETLPLLASRADKFTLVRSLFHDEAPIHETGLQLMQTGRVSTVQNCFPNYGSVCASLASPSYSQVPSFVVLPSKIGLTGVNMYQGQEAGFLGDQFQPVNIKSHANDIRNICEITHNNSELNLGMIRSTVANLSFDSRYGNTRFGQSCQAALALVESGVKFVTVNMFESVFNEVTWDCHADGGALASNLNDYRTKICPMFDSAYAALLDDLQVKGLLDSTLLVAVGEFGRSPYLNMRGGRDHHSGVWSGLLAGAGLPGGAVVGSSDSMGGIPKDNPVNPAMFAATIYKAMGIDPTQKINLANGVSVPLADSAPIPSLV
jgi:hypothetical protein